MESVHEQHHSQQCIYWIFDIISIKKNSSKLEALILIHSYAPKTKKPTKTHSKYPGQYAPPPPYHLITRLGPGFFHPTLNKPQYSDYDFNGDNSHHPTPPISRNNKNQIHSIQTPKCSTPLYVSCYPISILLPWYNLA